MRRACLIDARGAVRVATGPDFAEDLVYVSLTRSGAELAFHRGRVPLPALMRAMRLLASCQPRRIALRLLPEDGVAVRIFPALSELARHAERLARTARPPASLPARRRAAALTSRFSQL
jgi:hypothetical protein